LGWNELDKTERNTAGEWIVGARGQGSSEYKATGTTNAINCISPATFFAAKYPVEAKLRE